MSWDVIFENAVFFICSVITATFGIIGVIYSTRKGSLNIHKREFHLQQLHKVYGPLYLIATEKRAINTYETVLQFSDDLQEFVKKNYVYISPSLLSLANELHKAVKNNDRDKISQAESMVIAHIRDSVNNLKHDLYFTYEEKSNRTFIDNVKHFAIKTWTFAFSVAVVLLYHALFSSSAELSLSNLFIDSMIVFVPTFAIFEFFSRLIRI